MGNMNPAGAIPSVLSKRGMQTAEELENFPRFHLGGLRSPGNGDLHIVV